MAKFKVIISDPTEGVSKSVEVEGDRALPLIGKKIGDIVDCVILGLPGWKAQITGGSDKDGFPMRSDVHGGVRRDIILSKGPGFNPKKEGERRRKKVRGSMITEEIVQVNMKIIEKPQGKSLKEQVKEEGNKEE